jgi:hypothetical protein
MVLAALAAVVLAASFGWWHLFHPPGIDRRGFDRIRAGMSRREVEAILGGPPGDYRDQIRYPRGGCCLPRESFPPETDVGGYRAEEWTADEREVTVYFGADGTVADKGFLDYSLPPPSSWERLRQWLGL